MSSLELLRGHIAESMNLEVGLCNLCKEPFTDKNVFTAAGWRETKMSNTCERCFDKMFKDEE